MKLSEFNKAFPAACDKIYKTVGNKIEYNKKDAVRMSKKMIPIMATEFGIPKKDIIDHQDLISEIFLDISPAYIKIQKFDGILLACAFALLEGTGREKRGFGKWLMIRSIFMGGIKNTLRDCESISGIRFLEYWHSKQIANIEVVMKS